VAPSLKTKDQETLKREFKGIQNAKALNKQNDGFCLN
jgi:hypothetical protein